MKKWIIAAMLALAAACACPQPGAWTPARAAVAEESDFTITNGVLTAYTGTDADVVVPEGVTELGDLVFSGKGVTSVSLPSSLRKIGSSAFKNCTSLQEVKLPQGLESIGYGAFWGCDSLPAIDIPASVTSIGNYALIGCKGLEQVTLHEGLESIGSGAFDSCEKLASLVLPDSVKTLGSGVFSGTALLSVVLPDNLTAIGNYIADSSRELQVLCSRSSATARLITKNVYEYGFTDPAEPNYSWRYEGDGLVLTVYRGTAANVTVPGGVTAIGENAFYENKTLETLTLPEGLTEVGSSAFYRCEKLREVNFPSTLEKLGEWAFENCEQFVQVTLPDNVTTVDTYPFYPIYSSCLILCKRDSVTARSVSAASTGYRLCDPADPDWLWRYETDGSLSLCGYRGSASAITLPGWSTRVAADARWGGAKQLSSVVIPEGYTELGDGALFGSWLRAISLPSSLRTIGSKAFESNNRLSMLQLPEGLESIGEDAFWGCDSLTSLTIPTTVTSIPHRIAPYYEDLTTVVLPRELTTIADGAFGDALTTVYCYRNSYAEQWANDSGVPLIKYLDNTSLENRLRLTGPNTTDMENTVFEVGTTYAWCTGVSYGAQPPGKTYTLTCESANPEVARVDGDQVTFLAPGSATLTIGIAERPDVTKYRLPVQVYNPVRDFAVPETVFVKKDAEYDDWPRIMPAQVEPQDANPWFRWIFNNGYSIWEDTSAADYRIRPRDQLGMVKAEMEAYSGVKRPFLIVTYETIGEVYAAAPARSVAVGETYQPLITVVVDGVEMDNMPYLYTLKSSNTRVAAPTEDGKLRGVAPGTATITVTARESGKTARFTVTVANVARLTLPAAIKTVKREAFLGAPAEEIILPDGCETIESRAFADCTRLQSVTIPASVTSIAPDAFEGCGNITVITPADSTAAQTLGGLSGITVMEQ